jgi:hypothetical protein
MDAVRIDTSFRVAAAPTDIEWRAASDDGDRHAFPPPAEGRLPGRALCQVRWTVAFGKHGAGWCQDCIAVLKAQLRATSAALAAVDADDQRGDHYAGMGR